MLFLYISIFFFGVITTGVAIWARRKFIARQDKLKHKQRRIMELEKNGWIKTKYEFRHWTDRQRMEKWQKSIKDDLEISIWIHENIKGYFKVEYLYGIRYIQFAEEDDAVAFKLRWV